MILKILGILDIITALLLFASIVLQFNFIAILTLLAIYLISKGLIFLISKDIASILDIMAGVIILSPLSLNFVMPKFVLILVVLYLVQKGIFSLF